MTATNFHEWLAMSRRCAEEEAELALDEDAAWYRGYSAAMKEARAKHQEVVMDKASYD